MRRKLILLLVMLVVMSVALAIPADAKKPLGGEMELYFNLGFEQAAPCPHITWAGTVELEGTTYGMVFIPTGAKDVGKVHHFTEDWVIYDEPFTLEDDFLGGVEGVLVNCIPDGGDVVLAGTDAGVSTIPNSTYRMNGTVDDAFDPFAEWVGRNVHMSGDITWQEIEVPNPAGGLMTIVVPKTAPGYFQIN